MHQHLVTPPRLVIALLPLTAAKSREAILGINGPCNHHPCSRNTHLMTLVLKPILPIPPTQPLVWSQDPPTLLHSCPLQKPHVPLRKRRVKLNRKLTLLRLTLREQTRANLALPKEPPPKTLAPYPLKSTLPCLKRSNSQKLQRAPRGPPPLAFPRPTPPDLRFLLTTLPNPQR